MISSNGVTNLKTQIFTYGDLEFAIDRAVLAYFNINNVSTAQFQYGYRQEEGSKRTCSSSPGPIAAETVYWSSPVQYHTVEHKLYSASNISASSFIIQNRTDYFSHLDTLRLKFDLCSLESQYLLQSNRCNYWHVIVEYKSMSQMFLDTVVTARLGKSCSDNASYGTSFRDLTTYVDMLLVLIASLYAYLVLLDIRYAVRVYEEIKAAHHAARNRHLYRDLFGTPEGVAQGEGQQQQQQQGDRMDICAMYSWEEIPLGVRRSFHCYWSAATLLGLLLTLVASWQSLLMNEDRYLNLSAMGKLFLGGSSVLVWATFLQFFVVFPDVYSISLTMQTALPRVLAFFAGFLPVFLGFVVLGTVLFSTRMGMFASLSQGAWGLFSLMNGDSVQPIMLLMMTRSYAAALLFTVVFLLIMAYLSLNILIAIVEEAYFLAKRHDRNLEVVMWKNLEQMALESLEQDADAHHPAAPMGPPQRQEMDEEEDEHGDDWISSMFNKSHKPDPRMLSADPLLISLAEETAEAYILGRSHFEYSKVSQQRSMLTNDLSMTAPVCVYAADDGLPRGASVLMRGVLFDQRRVSSGLVRSSGHTRRLTPMRQHRQLVKHPALSLSFHPSAAGHAEHDEQAPEGPLLFARAHAALRRLQEGGPVHLLRALRGGDQRVPRQLRQLRAAQPHAAVRDRAGLPSPPLRGHLLQPQHPLLRGQDDPRLDDRPELQAHGVRRDAHLRHQVSPPPLPYALMLTPA